MNPIKFIKISNLIFLILLNIIYSKIFLSCEKKSFCKRNIEPNIDDIEIFSILKSSFNINYEKNYFEFIVSNNKEEKKILKIKLELYEGGIFRIKIENLSSKIKEFKVNFYFYSSLQKMMIF